MRKELSRREKADIRTLMKFIDVYCREKHEAEKSVFVFEAAAIQYLLKKKTLL